MAVYAMVAAVALSALGQIRSSQAQAASANYNAQLADQNAQIATAQGAAAAEAQERDSKRRMGSMVAAYGASGVQVDTGSPTDVLADSARGAALDNLTIKYNAKLRALGLQAQAGLDRTNAENSTQAGYINATSTVLSGASKMYGTSGGNNATGGVSLG